MAKKFTVPKANPQKPPMGNIHGGMIGSAMTVDKMRATPFGAPVVKKPKRMP